MITIKDLKKGDVIQSDNHFTKVISVINEDVVALSNSWEIKDGKEHISDSSQSLCGIYCAYDLKKYALVTPEWKASELKVGDKYWCLDIYGNVVGGLWGGDNVDRYRLKTNNIYQTEKDAEEAYELIMSKE